VKRILHPIGAHLPPLRQIRDDAVRFQRIELDEVVIAGSGEVLGEISAVLVDVEIGWVAADPRRQYAPIAKAVGSFAGSCEPGP
jgi:hypothetical protein